MAEEKKEPWLNYLALSTVIFAVCATLSTFKGGGFSTRSVMSQTQASDQWAYFQAKSIKSYLYQMQAEKMELELSSLSTTAPASIVAGYQGKIADYKKKTDKYEKEKSEIQQEAKRLEAVRDDTQRHAQIFGIAVIYLQIAILMSSIAALLKKRLVWFAGVAAGIVGLVYFADGFLLFL